MLAAIEAMTDADTVRTSEGEQPHRSAKASAVETIHIGSPGFGSLKASIEAAARHAQANWLIRRRLFWFGGPGLQVAQNGRDAVDGLVSVLGRGDPITRLRKSALKV